MMEKNNYYLKKDTLTGEAIFIDYNLIEGYNLTPQVELEDAIKVNKIIMINPSLNQKLITKKIEIKLRYLKQKLKELEEDEGENDGEIERTIIEAERLKQLILNTYKKYLGNSYESLTLKKIEVIINKLNKLKPPKKESIKPARKPIVLNQDETLYYEEKPKKGRGR